MKRTKKTLSNTEMKSLETTELAATTGGYLINGIDDEQFTKIHLGGGVLGGGPIIIINGLPAFDVTGFGH